MRDPVGCSSCCLACSTEAFKAAIVAWDEYESLSKRLEDLELDEEERNESCVVIPRNIINIMWRSVISDKSLDPLVLDMFFDKMSMIGIPPCGSCNGVGVVQVEVNHIEEGEDGGFVDWGSEIHVTLCNECEAGWVFKQNLEEK